MLKFIIFFFFFAVREWKTTRLRERRANSHRRSRNIEIRNARYVKSHNRRRDRGAVMRGIRLRREILGLRVLAGMRFESASAHTIPRRCVSRCYAPATDIFYIAARVLNVNVVNL